MNTEQNLKNQLIPSSNSVFFSKNDLNDPRLGDYFKPSEYQLELFKEDDFILLGYPDDEGIKLNQGRPGASEAPKLIRQFLYKMTWPYFDKVNTEFFDIGDLDIHHKIEKKHQTAKQIISGLHQKKTKILTFGGGHDYGYSDASAFVENYLNSPEKPVVINFDAHLDVRPTNFGLNSGTPFYRLLNEYHEKIDFIEIGIQPQCNSIFQREWALKKNSHIFDLKYFENNKNLSTLLSEPLFKKMNSKTPVFISFDIDCLSSSEAGGCSQSWVTGLYTQDCLQFLSALYRLTNCRGLGLYEVSPPFDFDFRTSKTAALFAYHFLFQTHL